MYDNKFSALFHESPGSWSRKIKITGLWTGSGSGGGLRHEFNARAEHMYRRDETCPTPGALKGQRGAQSDLLKEKKIIQILT